METGTDTAQIQIDGQANESTMQSAEQGNTDDKQAAGQTGDVSAENNSTADLQSLTLLLIDAEHQPHGLLCGSTPGLLCGRGD